MINSTVRSPKKTNLEMLELLTIVSVFKKNQKIFLAPNSKKEPNIQYDEQSSSMISMPDSQFIANKKKKSRSNQQLNLKQILENWQAQQIYIKDNIVSQNISKNIIINNYDKKNNKYFSAKLTKQQKKDLSSKQFHSQRMTSQRGSEQIKLPPLKQINQLLSHETQHKHKSTLGSLTKKMFSDKSVASDQYISSLKMPPIIIPRIALNKTQE